VLRSSDGGIFTASWVGYVDTRNAQQPRRGDPKIYIQIAVGTPSSSMLAMVDTGAAYSVLDADVAEELGAFDEAGTPQVDLATRHGLLRGRLVRRETWIVAQEGPTLGFEATFWVSRDWTYGLVLGYSGLLERIRFAIDPIAARFHFGSVDA
jgi:hypothetical protein